MLPRLAPPAYVPLAVAVILTLRQAAEHDTVSARPATAAAALAQLPSRRPPPPTMVL